MVCAGHAGAGKTAICESAISNLRFPNVALHCYGFTNSKQFIKLLWIKAVESLTSFNDSLGEKNKNGKLYGSDAFNLVVKSTKMPSKFGDLAIAMKNLIDSLVKSDNDNDEAGSLPANICFHLLLDRINELDTLESDLALRLLNLSKVF